MSQILSYIRTMNEVLIHRDLNKIVDYKNDPRGPQVEYAPLHEAPKRAENVDIPPLKPCKTFPTSTRNREPPRRGSPVL